jgi:hypothetical protein
LGWGEAPLGLEAGFERDSKPETSADEILDEAVVTQQPIPGSGRYVVTKLAK